ncbi:MAG: DNA-directed RNA polymerase subunit beta [bacterium]|nr:DNA-directed RNA polymerase subunit beta [candidate division KSB1 bacterium]MDH7560101.1 DNA-directed RNA polymerase subunit beta [bacterium]
MANVAQVTRKSFSKIASAIELPDLLDVQLKSFDEFLQPNVPPDKRLNQGLQAVFQSVFPIIDSRENFRLDFVEYYVERPRYSVEECQERGVTYAVPLKAKLRLSIKEDSGDDSYAETIEQVVYLGNIPYMTERGTFIINGAERIVVSQLHRSPGVFFDELRHPNGQKLFSARVIPLRGSWVEFTTDINDVMYAYIDRRKKFPVTTLLRAVGYSTDSELLGLFDLSVEVPAKADKLRPYLHHIALEDIVDEESGELLCERDQRLTEETIEQIDRSSVKRVRLLRPESPSGPEIISNTLRKDTARSEEDALETIYRHLRAGEPPDLEAARGLVERLFFNPKRYDLGKIGRHRLNKKLGLDIPLDVTVLTKDDIVAIIKYLVDLRDGKREADDIDHLGNRRVRTVGEQLAQQMSVGLSRMARTIKERMNLRESENLTPQDLVNARTILSVINTFFGTSQLSQFMDQTNQLAELTHKRRLSALGPGGLTRERAGFEVRDVHYTHYGRLCPIETPEGPNIGLISSLTTYGRLNDLGFIEAPYRKVVNGRVTDEIVYLTADEEENQIVAQANAPLDKDGRFLQERVKARLRGDFSVVPPEQVSYMDVSPTQTVSAAAALIPFLEHDDANRALMGSNMQRQAVPLLRPELPLIGTGLEGKVARDSRAIIVSDVDGVVEEVDADHIVIRVEPAHDPESEREELLDFEDRTRRVYRLTKFMRTNQDTCINQRPLVTQGQRVTKNQVLADGFATDRGELALGRNVLVAFMPWRGYNFEDAIIVSERIVREDIFTSLHIEEFDLQVRDTKRGEEELTREIPNVSEEATKDLDENGVVRVGAEVQAGDILVGKVTPKGETDPTPEEKLLKAIFGEKAGDVKDASLKVPPGVKGIVINTRLFTRKKKDTKSKKQEKKMLDDLTLWRQEEEQKARRLRDQKLIRVLDGKTAQAVRDIQTDKALVKAKTALRAEGNLARLDFDRVNFRLEVTEDAEANQLAREIIRRYEQRLAAIEQEYEQNKLKLTMGDELPPGIVQLAKVYVAKKRKLSVGDKMAGRHGNKGVVSKIVPVEDMPFLPDGTPVDVVLNPLGVPSRMNLGQIMECNLGWAAAKLNQFYASPVFDGATYEEVVEELKKAGLPPAGKTILYDGRTGEPFDQPVTVGYLYLMKLSHLVEDKIHARSIGPYSLITQQPLGGKAQFGGQRFGEMEVWALEAYGAAHTLQEILTVKSDDVRGRSKVYEAIVKGDNLPEPSLPESFNVLIRELQGLGLDVELIDGRMPQWSARPRKGPHGLRPTEGSSVIHG